jgi:hypothetical protein
MLAVIHSRIDENISSAVAAMMVNVGGDRASGINLFLEADRLQARSSCGLLWVRRHRELKDRPLRFVRLGP